MDFSIVEYPKKTGAALRASMTGSRLVPSLMLFLTVCCLPLLGQAERKSDRVVHSVSRSNAGSTATSSEALLLPEGKTRKKIVSKKKPAQGEQSAKAKPQVQEPTPPREETQNKEPAPLLREVTGQVQRGDTLASLLQRYRLPVTTALAVGKAAKPVFDISRNLKPKQSFRMAMDDKNRLISLRYPISDSKSLEVTSASQETFQAQIIPEGLRPESKPLELAPTQELSEQPDHIAEAVAESTGLLTREVRNLFTKSNRTTRVKIRQGDSLNGVLGRQGLSSDKIREITQNARPVFPLARSLRVDEELTLAYNVDGSLFGLMYPMDSERTFYMLPNENGSLVPEVEKKKYDVKLGTASGVITDSLFASGQEAGIKPGLIMELAKLFEYDIDFARNIKDGDSFRFIHEEVFHEGKKVRNGSIIAAEFVNQGQVYQVFRYMDPTGQVGYYTADGNNIRQMFIRAPVDFTRISSVFSNNRKHPVLGYTRAHKGVDYAASTGTPVRAAGNGQVEFVGTKSGYGNIILIRHNGQYTTAYGHLNSFRRGLKVGDRVQQGETIGTVGMTGLATGPHLHYEIRVAGNQVDPLSLKIPSAGPLSKKYLADFRKKTASMVAMMDSKENRRLAALKKK